MRRCLPLLLIILFTVSCRRQGEQGLPAQTLMNVKYGTDARQVMDVYLPANRNNTNTKVAILIHGGAWTSGDKADFNAYVDTLRRRLPDYAIFNITYRLAANGSNLFPAQENDVKQCVEFIFGKRSEYNISEKFVMLGGSAGAHLALLQSYKYSSPVKMKAVVSFFGPTELTDLFNNPPNLLVPLLLINVTGGTPADRTVIYNNGSPLPYATSASTPTLLLHGTADEVVPLRQSQLLQTRLNSLGVAHSLVVYNGEGHGWAGANLHDSFNRIQQFLNTHNP